MGNETPDYQAGMRGDTHYVPIDPVEYQRGQGDRAGRPIWGSGFSLGNGGGPAVLVALIVSPYLMVALIFLAAIFPIAGALTALGCYALFEAFFDDPTVSWIMQSLVLLLPAIIIFKLTMPLEARAAELPLYRTVRHGVRVIGVALAFNEIGLPILERWMSGPAAQGGWSLESGITLMKLIRVAAFMAAVHFAFRWLDRRSA